MARRIFDYQKDRRRKAWASSGAGSPPAGGRQSGFRRQRRNDGIPMRWIWGVLAAIVMVMIVRTGDDRPGDPLAFLSPPATETAVPMPLVGLAPATPRAAFAARSMPICGSSRRINCVVDGDTFWIDGEKVRVETIDAPEVKGRCAGESALAARATSRLAQLLSNRAIELSRNGTDRYGRTLARVRTPGGDVGAILIGEGLAQRWAGRKAEWCTT